MSLVLAFVPSKAPAPPPPPPTIYYKPGGGPITQAKPIAGGSYPRLKPGFAPPPPPPPPPALPAAAGGAGAALSLPGLALALALAIPQVLLFDQPLSPDQGNVPQPVEPPVPIVPPEFPFTGGQDPNATYNISYKNTDKSRLWRGVAAVGGITNIPGRITTAKLVKEFVGYDSGFAGASPLYRFHLIAANDKGFAIDRVLDGTNNGDYSGAYEMLPITRTDNGPDTGGNPPPTNTPVYSPPGNFIGPAIPAPPINAPSPIPGAPPITAPSPSRATPPGVEPPPQRYPVPAPTPAPGDTPQPNRYPDPAPEPDFFPIIDPSPTPGTGTGSPNPAPTPLPAPGTPRIQEPTILNPRPGTPPLPFVGNPLPAPAPFTPNPLVPSPLTPNPLAPSPFTPNPDTGSPEPQVPPIPAPPRAPDPNRTPIDDFRDELNRYLTPIAVAIAGITGLVQPERLREAANAGSCQSFAPGGCNAPIANNAASAAANSADNGTALASIMAFLQAIQTLFLIPIKAGVELINTKLGPVMAGVNGIGGFLARTAEAAKIDKVLGAMNTILLLHNAAMLSRNLGSTLGDLTSQALTTIGIKDSQGSPIDVNEILGKQANSFMESLVGAQVWAGTKASWNKASSIISSATNIMYTVRSMFDSTREILEWTAENTGKIGNALKRFRVVGENAYKWLPERVTVQNRFTRQIDRIREGTDSLDDAASSLSGVLGEVQSIQQEYADLQEQKQKFDKNISELTPKTRDEISP